MLENYVKEFLAICQFANLHEKKTLRFYLIEKAKLVEMLDQNKYETSTNKLKFWKGMNWIDTDDRKLTRRRYMKAEGKYKTFVCIYRKIHETLVLITKDDERK